MSTEIIYYNSLLETTELLVQKYTIPLIIQIRDLQAAHEELTAALKDNIDAIRLGPQRRRQ